MISKFTDEALEESANGFNRGVARAAGYLLTLKGENAEELRNWAERSGQVMSNVVPGYRYADGVQVMVHRISTGWTVEDLKDYYTQYVH